MLQPFFVSAAQAPNRQSAFRTLVGFHLVVMGTGFWAIQSHLFSSVAILGHLALVAGIVEGALLVGWRLTQLPKSRALEFLLASPLPPQQVFLAEALVGVIRLALVTLTGLPLLLLLAENGFLLFTDLPVLLYLPFTWGCITGIGLTAWAYETRLFRFWGERLMMGLILFYLLVGILAGEHLVNWLQWLPEEVAQIFLDAFYAFHTYNPFGVIKLALEESPANAQYVLGWVESISVALALALTLRGAFRMEGHYQDRHYSPIADVSGRKRKVVGDLPLSWWAVKRVSEYSGKVNLWLAGGFGILYSLHTVAGPMWPGWMGRQVFILFDRFFGVSGVATALMVLAAVPPAFQYGLWDSNSQDRCRRLELLLLSKLDAEDYWKAALAAAWHRGSGYFAIALLLWTAAALGGKITLGQAMLGTISGALMWIMYFSLGFRAFSTGLQANNLGLFLTAGLPLVTVGLFKAGFPVLAGLTPPGSVHLASISPDPRFWLPGIFVTSLTTLYLHRQSLANCLEELRHWYERYHGRKVMD